MPSGHVVRQARTSCFESVLRGHHQRLLACRRRPIYRRRSRHGDSLRLLHEQFQSSLESSNAFSTCGRTLSAATWLIKASFPRSQVGKDVPSPSWKSAYSLVHRRELQTRTPASDAVRFPRLNIPPIRSILKKMPCISL